MDVATVTAMAILGWTNVPPTIIIYRALPSSTTITIVCVVLVYQLSWWPLIWDTLLQHNLNHGNSEVSKYNYVMAVQGGGHPGSLVQLDFDGFEVAPVEFISE